MNARSRNLLGVFLFFALILAPFAQGQQSSSEKISQDLEEIETELTSVNETLSSISSDFEKSDTPDQMSRQIARLSSLRDKITTLEQRAISIRSDSREALDAVADLIPAEEEEEPGQTSGQTSDAVPESSETAAARLKESALAEVTAPFRDINRRASVAAANARLADIDARRLLDSISRSRENVFVSSVTKRGLSPIKPEVWAGAIQAVDDVWSELTREITDWRDAQVEKGTPYPLLILFGISFLLLAGLLLLYRSFYRWELTKNTETRPSRQTVAQLAMASFLARFVTAFAVVLALNGVAYLLGMNLLESEAGRSLAFVTIAVLCMRALVSAVMAPRTTAFRLIGVGDQAASAISLSFIVLVVAFAIESTLTASGALASPGEELIAVRTFCLALLTGGLLIWLAVRMKAKTERGKSVRRIVIRWAIIATAILIMASSLLGYHSLSRFVVERLILLSILLLIAILVREFLRATALKFLSGVEEERRYESARDKDDEDEPTEMNSEFWIRISVDTLVVLLIPPFLLLAMGIPASELWNELRWLLSGFEIAGQRISLGSILSAILTVIAIIVATRLIQRTLERQILPKSQISSGAANSLVTLLGYAGVTIAFISAIGVVGFDLSSLAIIAGALSVGIGFGLQSIVSNFVAGLILLFERPFKIGDWIVTPSGEGTVQKINVRATEVLTFDRRSIIVPNAELVSNAFGNWTHKSSVMRIAVGVGVKYGTDTRKVEKAIMEIAEANHYILREPPPYVILKEFGDSSVNFELRAYIIADHIVIAPSELKHEIARVFEREDIVIPFPQRDIHFDWPDAPAKLQRPDQGDEDGASAAAEEDSETSERPSKENEARAAEERDDTG